MTQAESDPFESRDQPTEVKNQSRPVNRFSESLGSTTAVVRPWDFWNMESEWRRLFGEGLGTFFLVVVAAGAPVIRARFGGVMSPEAEVTAPGLMVMATILFMGAVSGAHLNPAVTFAFALRGDFPWRRVPGYLVAQVVGAVLACMTIWGIVGKYALLGATEPGRNVSAVSAMLMELLLTVGLVSTILGTASAAQNVGLLGALAVGGYIMLAGLWSSPISGASMNPARSFGPDLMLLNFSNFWVYVIGPLAGAIIAVGIAFILRGPGGGRSGSTAAQGRLGEVIVSRDQP